MPLRELRHQLGRAGRGRTQVEAAAEPEHRDVGQRPRRCRDVARRRRPARAGLGVAEGRGPHPERPERAGRQGSKRRLDRRGPVGRCHGRRPRERPVITDRRDVERFAEVRRPVRLPRAGKIDRDHGVPLRQRRDDVPPRVRGRQQPVHQHIPPRQRDELIGTLEPDVPTPQRLKRDDGRIDRRDDAQHPAEEVEQVDVAHCDYSRGEPRPKGALSKRSLRSRLTFSIYRHSSV